jgi:hypothetical protein
MNDGLDLGNLIVHIRGDETGLEQSLDTSTALMERFEEEVTPIQKRIEESFKSAGQAFTEQLQEMAKYRQEFNQELNQQNIGSRPDFLSNLAGDEFSQELQKRLEKEQEAVQKTVDYEAFIVKRGLDEELAYREDALRKTQAMQDKMRTFLRTSFGRGTMLALGAYAAGRVIEGFTEGLKLYRTSGSQLDFVNGLVEGLPVIGRLSKSIRELANEMSGYNRAVELAAKSNKFFDEMSKIDLQHQNTMALIGASPEEAGKININFVADTKILEYKGELVKAIDLQKELATKFKKQTGFTNADLHNNKELIARLGMTEEVEKKSKELRETNEEILNINRKITQVETERAAQLKEHSLQAGKEMLKSLSQQIEVYGKEGTELVKIQMHQQNISGELANQIMLQSKKLDMLKEEEKEQKKIEDEAKNAEAEEKRFMEERASYIDSVVEQQKNLQSQLDTYGMSEGAAYGLNALQEALDKGIGGEELEALKSRLVEIEDMFDRLEQKKAFDIQKKELADFYSNLQQEGKTPLDKFKDDLDKLNKGWSDKYGPWAAYNEQAKEELKSMKKTLFEKYFSEEDRKSQTPISQGGTYGYDARYINASALSVSSKADTEKEVLSNSKQQTKYQRQMAAGLAGIATY